MPDPVQQAATAPNPALMVPAAPAWPPADPATVLAATAWMEAQGDGKDGMQAVMSVVLNRARSGITWWGGPDIRSVCLAHEQFSSWNADCPLPAKAQAQAESETPEPAWRTAVNLAALAVQGILPDNTQNCDSYFATSIQPPAWAAAEHFVVQIGSQRFYRLYLNPPGIVAGPEA